MRGVGLVGVGVVTVGMILACGTSDGGSSPEVGAPTPEDPTPTASPPVVARTLPPGPAVDDAERPDDCTLEVAGLEARFLPEQPGSGKVEVVRGANGLVESFVMSDGTPVRSDYGGCYHVGVTESYMLEAPPSDPLAAAREVMSKVARASGDDSLVKALEKAKSLDEGGSWDCGEFNTCGIRTDGALLEISWSFAM